MPSKFTIVPFAEKDAVEMVTPYIYHYYIEALLKCGAKDEALAVMKNYWGGMAGLVDSDFIMINDKMIPIRKSGRKLIVKKYEEFFKESLKQT